jgi:hypothetical protein
MRSFLHAMVLALTIGALSPYEAFGQDFPEDDDIEMLDDEAPQPKQKGEKRPRGGWRNSPFVWGFGTIALAVAIPLGVFKIVMQMRHAQAQQARPKAAWERDTPV